LEEKRVSDDRRNARIDTYYRWISGLYGLHEGWFEKTLRETALEFLSPSPGERVLEVGCGTGFTLREIVRRVGASGCAHGLDVSTEMLARARARAAVPEGQQPNLVRADAAALPYGSAVFDAAYMSGVLELFEDAGRSLMLNEVRRVLRRPGGRFVLATMTDDGRASGVLRFYEWMRTVLPGIVPCRSVDAERLAVEAGFTVRRSERIRLNGLVPIQVLLLRPQEQATDFTDSKDRD
jgi:ubiquinone/menaquinone biosynthesis C-methylase UbiE